MLDLASRTMSSVVVHQGAPGGIGQAEALLDRALQALGGRTITIARQTARNPLSRQTNARLTAKSRFALRVVTAVMRTRPDLILITHLNLSRLIPVLRAVCPSSRIVCMAYGVEAWRPLTPSARLGLSAVDAVWCISDFTRGMLRRESDVPVRKLHLLPLALSDDKVRLIESFSHARSDNKSRPFELLSVTRLLPAERYKGIEHVLSALTEVRLINPNVRYHLVGDGADRPALSQIASDLGIRAMVTADGALDDEGLARVLSTCDAFILPSAKEGFGLAHLEAMCAAKPVIASHAAATPEVVDQATGILIPFGDTEGLTDAILRLMDNGDLCSTLGANGQSRFRKLFTETVFQARLRHLLELL